MLGILLKYEFQATARSLCPLYLALIIMSFVEKMSFSYDYDTKFGKLILGISTVIYIVIIVSSFIVTTVIIINRFRKNLLLDEGYLMNTLPIEPWQNILSKLIVAAVWSIISTIVGVISIVILLYKQGIITEFINQIGIVIDKCYGKIGASIYVLIIEILVITILAIVREVVLMYAAICVGNLAKKRKVLAGFGAYIGINVITSSLSSIFSIGYTYDLEIYLNENNLLASGLCSSFFFGIIVEIILAVMYFLITNYILKNKLNLQ